MQKSFVRQTRSKTRATQEAARTDFQPCVSSADNAAPGVVEQTCFESSVIDLEHGNDTDCVKCMRPNNAELYMVQCGTCKCWYHLTCANVDEAVLRSSDFVCSRCLPKIPAPPRSSTTGRTSVSSSRRSQIARELQQLEDERLLREKLEEERLLQEKLLVEKAMNEKLEREKEYLARKHELLRQQDEDAASIQSSRSGRSQASSRQKVEAWFNQQLMSVDSSDNASNQRQKLSGQTAGPVGSSTPMETSRIIDEGLLRAHSGTRQNVGSIPRTTDSISIGDSPGVEDDVNPPNAAKQSKVQSLPLVNIQPYVKILDEANPMTSETALTNTGYPPRIIPKLMGNPLPFTAWQRETSEMRKQHLREHQCPDREAELRQSEQREQELIHLLKRSEEQREQDRQRLQEIEEILKKQHDVEAQHQKENYVRRRRELELVNRLKLFEQEYAQEIAKRDEEKQKYLAKEQQLIEVSCVRRSRPHSSKLGREGENDRVDCDKEDSVGSCGVDSKRCGVVDSLF
nr:GRB10-interacting GYF protein 2-like [Aedes albopictus]